MMTLGRLLKSTGNFLIEDLLSGIEKGIAPVADSFHQAGSTEIFDSVEIWYRRLCEDAKRGRTVVSVDDPRRSVVGFMTYDRHDEDGLARYLTISMVTLKEEGSLAFVKKHLALPGKRQDLAKLLSEGKPPRYVPSP